MRKIISFFLAVSLMCSSFYFGKPANADNTAGLITTSQLGTVVQVIDADAVVVRLYSGSIAYVKLVGVNSATREGGLKFMQDNAFGRTVLLVPDHSGIVSSLDGRWNRMYVYLSPDGSTTTIGKDMLNILLLQYGYAEADARYSGVLMYDNFTAYQKEAKNEKLGMWGDGSLKATVYSGEKININTASRKILTANMVGNDLTDTLINNIMNYRSYNPFSSVSELKFVKGMTSEIYANNKNLFTVITNINTASEKELKSLEGTAEDVDNIIKYRSSKTFKSLKELYQQADVSEEFYMDNRYYISVDNSTKMLYTIPQYTVNINTASHSQLQKVSNIGSSVASDIISQRSKGYTFKSLFEIQDIAGLTTEEIHRIEDNLHAYTDINRASEDELESLFGDAYISKDIINITDARHMSNISSLTKVLTDDRYNKIKDFIYCDEYTAPERINLNTASEAELRAIGMSASEANSILNKQMEMTKPSNIPFNISHYDKSVSLYTDINTASLKELRSLNAFSEATLTQIINYRTEQPFGSDDELLKFFEDNNLYSSYKTVSDFIVVR